jgi:hypothetical protein
MATHTLNFPGANLNATETTVDRATIGNIIGGLTVDTDNLVVDGATGAVTAGGVVSLTGATEATSSTTGALKVSGGVGIGNRAYISGGLITNTSGVAKKTYSQTGTITSGASPGVVISFSNHAFSARITAQLIESDEEISSLFIDVTGGKRGGSTSALNIAKGQLSICGDVTSNPWSSTVGVTTTTVTITPSTNLDGEGHYNIFVEYISAETNGSVVSIGGVSTNY